MSNVKIKIDIKKRGFTLIELLVVIAIIGLLSSVVLASLNSARNKARIARAQSELKQLRNAVEMLYDDTGLHPYGHTFVTCDNPNHEVDMNTQEAGIQATDGSFPNWKGPYMASVPADPWGTQYRYDPDYECDGNQKGCESAPGLIRALVPFGPNKTENEQPIGSGPSDDIVHVVCK